MCSLLFTIIVFFNASVAMQHRSYSIEEAIGIREQSGWTLSIINPTSLALRLWIIPQKEVLKRTYNPAYLAWLPPGSGTIYHLRPSDRNKNPYLLRVLYYQNDNSQGLIFKEDREINNLSNHMLLVIPQ